MPDRSDLMQRRALPLRAKVLMTQNRIREWYQHFNGDVYVSFSGGKDSTVLAHLVHDLYPDVPLVFSNTGLEYPEIQSFARKMGAEFIRPKMQFSEVISKYGYPIISKEVSEAIYYARRIRNGGGYGTTKKYRDDFHGLRMYGQQTPERTDGRERQNFSGGGYKETERRRENLHGQYQTELAYGRERTNCKVHSTDRKRIQFAGEYGRIGVAQETPPG